MSKISKRYSQTLYLFVVYGLFILALLVIFFVYTYSYYRSQTLESAKISQENMCASVQNSVDTQLDTLSTISMNMVYSNAVKSNFKEFSRTYQETGEDPQKMVASHEKALAIHDIVTAMIGAYQSASDIKLYTMDGSCVESGYRLSTRHVNITDKPWYDKVMSLNGHKYITTPTVDRTLPATGANHESQKFVSLVRLFFDSADEPEGIVEVIQDCNKLFSLATQLEQNNDGIRVYVYDSEGRLMYPYNLPEESSTAAKDTAPSVNYASLANTNRTASGSSRLITIPGEEPKLITRELLKDYGWNVIVTRTESSLYQPLYTFRKAFVLIMFISILLTLVICYFISKSFTEPLRNLTKVTGQITINRVLDEEKVDLTSADSRIKELSILCDAIRDMYEKLRSTSQEVLLSHHEETRAKLQATQSLINPHFLYNSLTSISVMAEEEMNEDIIRMCLALCDYFRYISSTKDMVVSLDEEIHYTKRYLECMQIRFSEELEYDISIPDNAQEIQIPKLITQPIVENAFKYAFTGRPPWKLAIHAEANGGNWLIKITDNGGNMSEERKRELLSLYENLEFNKELQSMQIGGMGLKNVYLRMRLIYGEDALFRIDTSVPNQTTFVLGGKIYYSKEDYYEQHLKL